MWTYDGEGRLFLGTRVSKCYRETRAASKKKGEGTDLPGSSVNKEGLRVRIERLERFEAADEGLEGIRGMERESDVECIQSPT